MVNPVTSTKVPIACPTCKTLSEQIKKCSRCHALLYCSRECQIKDWPIHKLACRSIVVEKKEDDKQKILWSAVEKEFSQWNSKGILRKTGPEKATPLITEFFQESGEGKLAVDLGCGYGFTSTSLLQRGWKVIALDHSAKDLEIMGKLANKANRQWLETGQLVIKKGNLENLELDVEPDLIVIADTLPFINPTKVRKLWDHLFKSLKEDGKLVGSFFRRTDPVQDLVRRSQGVWFVSNEGFVKDLLISSSYKIEICRIRPKNYVSSVIEFIVSKVQK